MRNARVSSVLPTVWLGLALAGALALWPAESARAEAAFEVVSIPTTGRTVAAELADVDGDGRTDLLEIAFLGMPPRERRVLRVYRQTSGGELPTEASLGWEIPEGSAAYDLADVDPTGGVELLLLGPAGLDVVSFEGLSPRVREIDLGVPTLIAASDERGLDRLRIVTLAFGDPLFVVPAAGETLLVELSGKLRARLRTPMRANYVIPPRDAPVAFDSDFQMFVDAPRIEFGDVDGDRRTDVVAASRHELRVYLQGADGGLPAEPSRRIPLGKISHQDHIRATGNARATFRDIDRDGRTDLLLSHNSGSITDSRTRTTIHLNRDGGWALDAPDQVFTSEGSFASDQLIDLDGDGRLELLRIEVASSIFEILEAFVQRAFDVQASAYQQVPKKGFSTRPFLTRKLGVPFDFETSRPSGFLPSVLPDLNGDGHRDLLTSASGEALEVFLGGPGHRFSRRSSRQELDTVGRVRFGSWDRSGRTDLVIYAPQKPGTPLRVALNRGRLPGTPFALRRPEQSAVGAGGTE